MHIPNGSMKFENHFSMIACNPWCSAYITTFPVFRPNEYFFQNHQLEGEERWETYARVIRTILSETMHLKLSEATIEDKF